MQIWQQSKGSEVGPDKMLSALANIGASTTAIRQNIEKVGQHSKNSLHELFKFPLVKIKNV